MDLIQSQTFTLTFSESVENHTGMQVIGKRAEKGVDAVWLRDLSQRLGYDSRQDQPDACINPDACIVIFRDGLRKLCGTNPDELYIEQHHLKKTQNV